MDIHYKLSSSVTYLRIEPYPSYIIPSLSTVGAEDGGECTPLHPPEAE